MANGRCIGEYAYIDHTQDSTKKLAGKNVKNISER